jgi:transposase
MEVLYPRCCGLDVHKKTVVACVITPGGKEIRTFRTMTSDLLELADWIEAKDITHVAMESTGVYWHPIYNILETLGLTLLVMNAQHIKAVPGRKTDVKDAEWITDLLRHGLVVGSFIPNRPQRELRELVRYRRGLIRQRGNVVNRIQKVLEGANIKLSSVASNVVGTSGRAMLEAITNGVEDPQVLAGYAVGRLKKKHADLVEALTGVVGQHQRAVLRSQLRVIAFLDEEVSRMDAEIAERMLPFEEAVERIDGIPGMGRRTAEEVLAELGGGVSRFPTAAQLASWAKLCPGNNESAGKRKATTTGHGNPWLRDALVEAAWAASHTHGTYLAAQYHRLAARRGPKRAIMAVAHSILVIVYSLLRNGGQFRELGQNYFDERHKSATIRRAVRRIEGLGFQVQLQPV